MQDFELSEPNFHPSGWLVQEIELSELIIRPGRHLVQDFKLSEPIRARTDSESSISCPNTTKTRPQPRFRIRKVRNPAPNAQPTRAEATHPHAKRAPALPARRACLCDARKLLRESTAKRAPTPRARGFASAMRGEAAPKASGAACSPACTVRTKGLPPRCGGRRGNRSALCLMRRPPRRPAARLARRPILPEQRVCLRWW